jgi:hypothetical protein
MSEHYTCDCGEVVDPKGTPHECPGTPNDRLGRVESDVEDLESEVDRLKRLVVALLTGRPVSADEVNALLAEVDDGR